jgi:hypothetical protein
MVCSVRFVKLICAGPQRARDGVPKVKAIHRVVADAISMAENAILVVRIVIDLILALENIRTYCKNLIRPPFYKN